MMDKYSVVRQAGRGAYGTVYLARRNSDGREVILKQIPVDMMSTADRQSILNEIKVLAMLHHPNVTEYYENFLQDKAMVIVMEYAAGGTLYDLLDTKARAGQHLEEEEVAHLFAQIVLAMQYVHQNQILHRDIKSQNIFLTRSLDHVKIGDFGISKILSSKSKALTVVGTPCYISPELCEGRPYNTKSDIWSLGCILYELCACKRAFEAPTLPALVMKIIRGVTPPLPAQYSPGVRQLLACLLSTEPALRPTIAECSAHHWIAPYILRVATTVGAIPCTARPPRPLSVTRPEDLEQPESLRPLFTTRRRSPSPFQAREQAAAVVRWSEGTTTGAQLPVEDPRAEVVGLGLGGTTVAGVDSSGQVVLWEGEAPPRVLAGTPGITVVRVAVGEAFLCILTDRGIMLTRGRGASGCLGHGDARDVGTPRIVEALLGEDVVEVEAGTQHVAVVTSDGELFTWGQDSGGCLGAGRPGRLLPIPEVVDLEEEVARVRCGAAATAAITPDGRLLVAGRLVQHKVTNLFYLVRPKLTNPRLKQALPGTVATCWASTRGRGG